MDELSDVLCQIADLSECVHFDTVIQQAAERASLVINAFVEELDICPLDVFM